jgi:hypothetical protein
MSKEKSMRIVEIEVPHDELAPHERAAFVTDDGDMYAAVSMFVPATGSPVSTEGMPIIVNEGYAYVSLWHIRERFPNMRELVARAFAADLYLAAMAMFDTTQESDDDADVIAYPAGD